MIQKILLFFNCLILCDFAHSQSIVSFTKDGKVGYKNSKTQEIIIQPIFSYGEDFIDSLAIVSNDLAYTNTAMRHFVINTKGESISKITFAKGENLGKGLIKIGGLKDGNVDVTGGTISFGSPTKFGLMNKQGTIIFLPEFSYISHVINNMLIVKKKGSSGIINTDGNYILPLQNNYQLSDNFQNGFLIISEEGYRGKKGFINKDCKVILEPEKSDFDEIEFNKNGIAKVRNKLTGLYGLMDSSGVIIIEPKFAFCYKFNDTQIIFKDSQTNNVSYIFDGKGNKVIKR